MQISIPVPADFSFQETLAAHGWRCLLPFVWNEDMQTLERVEELKAGNVVLLRLRGEGGQILIDI